MKRKTFSSKIKFYNKVNKSAIKFKHLGIYFLILFIPLILGGIYVWYRERYNNFIEIYNNYQPAFAPGDVVSQRRSLSENISFNLLLLGLDQKESGHIKADAVFIAHYDSVSKHFQIFELPNKINYYWPAKGTYVGLSDAYAFGQLQSPESGYALVQNIVEYNLAIKIDAYVASDTDGLAGVVAHLGNISVHNEHQFVDGDLEAAGVRDSFPEGSIDLDSSDMMAFVRADENGFYSKSLRHYSVMRSIIDSLTLSSLYLSIGSFSTIDEHIYSNIDGDAIRQFVKLLSDANVFTFDFYQLDPVLSKIDGVDGDVFDPIKFDDFVASTFDNSEIVREQARIEVYNSTSVSGLASKYTRILQNMGCDIIRKSNTSANTSKTVIFAQNPELFPLTIMQIKEAFNIDIEVVNDTLDFVTTGDLIILLADDVENI